jgi:3-deoxy-D-manno-octulosonic-acid transferase
MNDTTLGRRRRRSLCDPTGECVLCLPLIHRVVVEYNEKVLILVTVRSEDALELLQSSLPDRVLLLRAPEDTPFAVCRFMEHWRPCIGVMMSAWLAPNLVVMSAQVRSPSGTSSAYVVAHAG